MPSYVDKDSQTRFRCEQPFYHTPLTHGFVAHDTVWFIIFSNEYTSLVNAHYCLLFPQSHTHE